MDTHCAVYLRSKKYFKKNKKKAKERFLKLYLVSMNVPNAETAHYVIIYYSKLLTDDERKALRYYRSTVKLEGDTDERRKKMYYKAGWLSTDPNVLALLENGYEQFAMNCAARILSQHPTDVLLNNCPLCGRLARTPQAKQCRWCGHNWHQSIS